MNTEATDNKATVVQQLLAAVENLANLNARLTDAREEARQALSRETTLINSVNEAQRHFDTIAAEMKKDAPFDSDWKKKEGHSDLDVAT